MQQPNALERFIAKLNRHSDLSAEDVQTLLGIRYEEIAVDARAVIARPNAELEASFLVVRGLLCSFEQLPDGTRQINALHVAGELCSLNPLAQARGSTGVQALTSVTALCIAHEQLLQAAMSSPTISLAFWRDSLLDASVLAKWIGVIGRRKARSRLAHLLCEMGVRMERAGLGERKQFSLPLTQSQLADVLGLTLTRVHSSLRAFERDGTIERYGSEIRVLNYSRLVDCAVFDPGYLMSAKPKGRQEQSSLFT